MKNIGRVVSRTDIPREEFARVKMIPEDVTIADRINQLTDEYKKYLQ